MTLNHSKSIKTVVRNATVLSDLMSCTTPVLFSDLATYIVPTLLQNS